MEMDRDTLTKLIASVDADISKAELAMLKLRARRQLLAEWLADVQPQPVQASLDVVPDPGTPLAGFLRNTLADGKARSLGELGVAAQERGLIEDGKSPGRVVHFALVGLKQHGLVDKNDDGEWHAKRQRH